MSTTPIRISQFNASLNRNAAGQLVSDLSTPDNAQAKAVAEIIQRVNPDVLLVNEFDYVEGNPNLPVDLFRENYLSVSQNGAAPVEYPYAYIAPSNTGIASGFDLDNNGVAVTTLGAPGYGNDAFGFGNFPGQFGMLLLSKYPIDTDNVRTFQKFLWKDMPGARLPDDPNTPAPQDWYSAEELEVFRLSSKSHWDVPIQVNGETIHILASHPTPPVFDGPEDRNGTRNADEIRFWSDYVTPGKGEYIYDDAGSTGGLASGSTFVIMGDQNSDPNDGDSIPGAIQQILNNPLVNNSVTPSSPGGPEQAALQGGANLTHKSDPKFDTADFADGAPGNLRVDYVLPSSDLQITDAQVFWPASTDPLFRLVGTFNPALPGGFPSSDHRLVYLDVVKPDRKSIKDIDFLGEVSFATGTLFEDTEVGGLSGITYDADKKLYYSISDDRSEFNPARFYTLDINLSDGLLDEGDVTLQAVTELLDANGKVFPEFSVDPEGIALTQNGTLYISSEGEVRPDLGRVTDPFVNEFSLNGQQIGSLTLPEKYLASAGDTGVRNNLALESLTITPNGRFLYTATENALKQDGPAASLTDESLSRILKYDLKTGEVVSEFVYVVDTVADAPVPAGTFSTNGLVDLLAIDNNGTLLSLERSFSNGVGNTVKLFEVRTQGALDVKEFDDLFSEEAGVPFIVDPAVNKRELLDFADLGITPDNLEGLTLGPKLADGRQSLIVVADNNFNPTQKTQIIGLALDVRETPVVLPKLETPQVVDSDENVPAGAIPGDADDPAIWVDPSDASKSLVITALKDGGLAVYDLKGQLLQNILPADFGDIRYNNVDVLYNFPVKGRYVGGEIKADLAIFTDRENDTLAIYQIDPTTRLLVDVTSVNIPETIFGIDDSELTAYGIATYTSPVTGKSYVFVSQREGTQIAQLELMAEHHPGDAGFSVNAQVVRTLTFPAPTDPNSDNPQVEGMVVDQETGMLYAAQEQAGIWKFDAEVSGKTTGKLIEQVRPNGDNLEADVEGLTIYYADNGTGYLLASSQGDSRFAVYRREGENEFIGDFAIGSSGDIDSTEESDGSQVINVPLGPDYPFGLFVAHDGSNDPQVIIEDEGEIQNISTNFKYVPWQNIANVFSEKLKIDTTTYNPRNPVPTTLPNGVASGDTTQNSTVLWTRSTVKGQVKFEYSTDPDFKTIVGVVTETVTDAVKPVKAHIKGLNPGTQYYYRVTDAAGVRSGGEFKTSVSLGTQTGLRFGAAGDWQQAPPFPSLSNVDEQDLEFLIKLGDTIYADIETPALPGVTQARTLSDFRTKHSEILSTRFGTNFMAEVNASTSILTTIDDHELVDNFAGGAAPGESPDAPDIGSSPDPLFTDDVEFVNDTRAYEDALQAHQEYHPVKERFYGETGDRRTAGERKLYRNNTYGSDAAVFVLDSRSFRDAQIDPFTTSNPTKFFAEAFDPRRTLLGKAQLNEVKADLLKSERDGVTWKFVVIPEPIQNFGPVNAEDRFEGYAAERTELLKFIDDNNIRNVVFLAGDFHGTLVNNLTYQTGPGQAQIDSGAFEVVTGPAAFFDGLFGPAVVNIATAAGLLTPQQRAFYDLLPVAGDRDSIVNDKDDFVKQLLNQQISAFGYDPMGLNANLPGIQGVDATLLQGDYVATHTFGWTQFDIDPTTQKLLVTTYGIPPYSEAELLANPEDITSRVPAIVSQFEVNPNFTSDSDSQFGTQRRDTLFGNSRAETIDGRGGNDTIYGNGGRDTLIGGAGNDTIYGASQADTILGGEGNDTIYSNGGNDFINTGAGLDTVWLGGAATVELEVGDGFDTIKNFQLGQTKFKVSNTQGLSFANSKDGAQIFQGDDLIAVVTWQTANTFSNNVNKIFVV